MTNTVIEEAVIKFTGLPPSQKEQPEVIDPKTGKPYNLNDPDLPVVKGQTFTYYYWKMPKTKATLIKYLQEHWVYFNKTRFDSRLKPAKLSLMKDIDAAHMHKRGYCKYGTPCTIFISPNLFNAPHEGWVNNTLIHEMAHQDVYEQWLASGLPYSLLEVGKLAHGPEWRRSMLKAGLPAHAKDSTRNDTYMDEKETYKKDVYTDAYKRGDLYIYSEPRTGAIAAYYDREKNLVIGRIVGRSTKKPKHWVVIKSPSIFSFSLVPDKLLLWPRKVIENPQEHGVSKNKDLWDRTINKLIDQKIAIRVV